MELRRRRAGYVDEEPTHGVAPEVRGTGRVCAAPGCTTVLHRYHTGYWCYVHERPIEVVRTEFRANSRPTDDMVDFVELMEDVA